MKNQDLKNLSKLLDWCELNSKVKYRYYERISYPCSRFSYWWELKRTKGMTMKEIVTLYPVTRWEIRVAYIALGRLYAEALDIFETIDLPSSKMQNLDYPTEESIEDDVMSLADVLCAIVAYQEDYLGFKLKEGENIYDKVGL